ncbi:MAG: sulfur oxidation c-type cytochrome SoxX [Betaproteobacteria bacterium]|nr:sulfur oxidation c-type cytochrome SoxX [Betaproteobacteria bacterium]
MTRKTILAVIAAMALIAGCATMMSDAEVSKKSLQVMKSSFKERGQAKLDRLDQDEVQAACSLYGTPDKVPKDVAQRLEQGQLKAVRYPADGKFVGDWKAGETIAQSGAGKQFNDDPTRPSGANCYACHQLSKQELSFGTIGPTLLNYGKLRGSSEEIRKYTYAKVYNSNAFSACSNMPRFGYNGILTEQQMKDVVALLLDPESPVNK